MHSTSVASRLEEIARIVNKVEKEYAVLTYHASSHRKRQYAKHILDEATRILKMLGRDVSPERKARFSALKVQYVQWHRERNPGSPWYFDCVC